MKTIKLLLISLMTVLSFNAFGMEEGIVSGRSQKLDDVNTERSKQGEHSRSEETISQSNDMKAEEEDVSATGQGTTIHSLAKLATATFVKTVKEDYTLEQLLQDLNDKDYKGIEDLIAQEWMKDHPVFEELIGFCPLIKREDLKVENEGICVNNRGGCVDWSPDGKHLVIADQSRGEELTELLYVADEKVGVVKSFDRHGWSYWSPDGKHLVIKYRDCRAELLCVADGKVIESFENIHFVRWSPDSKHLMIMYGSGRADLLKLENKIAVIVSSFENIKQIWLSPNRKWAVIKYNDDKVKLLDLANNRKVVKKFKNINWIYWSPNSSQFVIECKDRRLFLFNLASKKFMLSFGHTNNLNDNSLGREQVTWSPDSKQVLIWHGENRARLFKGNKKIKGFLGIHRVNFSPDSKRLTVIYTNCKAELLNAADVSEINRFENVCQTRWSPDSNQLVIMDLDHGASLLNAEDGRVVRSFKDIGSSSVMIDPFFYWSPDSNQVVILYKNKKAELWQKDESVLKELREITSYGQATALEKVHEVLLGSQSFKEKKTAIESLKQQNNVGNETIDKVLTFFGS